MACWGCCRDADVCSQAGSSQAQAPEPAGPGQGGLTVRAVLTVRLGDTAHRLPGKGSWRVGGDCAVNSPRLCGRLSQGPAWPL